MMRYMFFLEWHRTGSIPAEIKIIPDIKQDDTKEASLYCLISAQQTYSKTIKSYNLLSI